MIYSIAFLFIHIFFVAAILEPIGLNLINIVREMRGYMQSRLNSEREQQSNGGRSLIALVVAENAAVNEGDSNTAAEHLWVMRETSPDLRWIYWAAGSPNRFERFVREPARDLFSLRIDITGIGPDSIQTVAHPVIHRIQQEPRRIINHRYVCAYVWRLISFQHPVIYLCHFTSIDAAAIGTGIRAIFN
jgi:hypothetical protein